MYRRLVLSATVFFVLVLFFTTPCVSDIIYVDDDATGANNGSCWEDAYNFLQDVLSVAVNGDEIRVAQGVYNPDKSISNPTGTKDRTASFSLASGLTLKGGYAGSKEADPDARDFTAYTTILSGDLKGDDKDEYINMEDNSLHVVTLNNINETVIDGFVIMGGNGNGGDEESKGGGVYILNSNATIRDCKFQYNKVLILGGAILTKYSNLSLEGCVFTENKTESNYSDGGAIFNVYGELLLNKCFFRRNYARDDGGALCNWESNTTIINCIFNSNDSGSNGGAIYCAGECPTKIINSSLVYNTAIVCGGLYARDESPEISNSIFWGNSDYDTNEDAQIFDKIAEVNYCCIEGLTGELGGEGNTGDNPFFVDSDGIDDEIGTDDDNFHLLPWSPCIDAGNNMAFLGTDLTDFDGLERFIDVVNVSDSGKGTSPIIDMGPFEQPNYDFIISDFRIFVPEGGTAIFTVSLAQNPNTETTVSVSVHMGDPDIIVQSSDTLIFDSTNYSQPQSVTLYANEDLDHVNNDAYILISCPGLISGGVIASEDENEPYANTLLVDRDADGSNNGSSWEDAFNDLQTALEEARANPEFEEIWVAQGTYTPTGSGGDNEISFELINGLTIKGGFAGYGEPDPDLRDIEAFPTILSGDLNGDDVIVPDAASLRDEPSRLDNSICVIKSVFNDATAVIDGLTIKGGYNRLSYPLYYGGGIYCRETSPTISNCTFTYNVAHRGGAIGIYELGHPIIKDCIFEVNLAYDGGAITNSRGSRIQVENCVFRKNFAEYSGGAIHGYESCPTFDDCEFIQNEAINYGGAVKMTGSYATTSDPLRRTDCTFNNCTFSDNSSMMGGAILNYESMFIFNNCIFIGNTATNKGGGLFSSDSLNRFLNCKIKDNSALNNGGGIYITLGDDDSELVMMNCIIQQNSARYGGGLSVTTEYLSTGCPEVLTNCTFYKNSAEQGGAIYNDFNNYSNQTITNCIFWGNLGDSYLIEEQQIYTEKDLHPVINYCCIQGFTGRLNGVGNVSYEPRFVDAANSNLQLQCDSALIDIGTNDLAGLEEVDFSGNPRVQDGDTDGIAVVDMGAYEAPSPEGQVIIISELKMPFTTFEKGIESLSRKLYVSKMGDGELAWTFEPSEGCDWLSVGPTSGIILDGQTAQIDVEVNTSGLEPGEYTCEALFSAPEAVNSPRTVEVSLTVTGPIIKMSESQVDLMAFDKKGPATDIAVLQIRNIGGGILNPQIEFDCEWLSVELADDIYNNLEKTLKITADSKNLEVGDYSCVLTVSDPKSSDEPISIPITFRVRHALHVPKHYPNIQSAIGFANSMTDAVLVADGIYTGDGNRDIDFMGKAIAVVSENGPENCIIDCQGSDIENHRGFIFTGGQESNAILDGFTIQNGYAEYGGGIYCGDVGPHIKNCVISNNSAKHGGGIFCDERLPNHMSSLRLYNCRISGNTARVGQGGGIYCKTNSYPFIEKCNFNYNVSGNGGAIYCYNTPINITGSVMSNNIAEWSGAIGGGTELTKISNCTIINNTAFNGAGGAIGYCKGEILNCKISFNKAIVGSAFTNSDGKVIGCVIDNNTGERNGVFAGCGCDIINCTIAYNTATDGYGGLAGCSGQIVNSIIWGNTAPQIFSCSMPVNCCIQDWENEDYSNISTDPMLALDTDMHLLSDSPCIDPSPGNYLNNVIQADLDQNIRVLDGDIDGFKSLDIGAFEYNPHQPSIVISKSEFSFLQDFPTPTQQLIVAHSGGGVLNWQIEEDYVWLDVQPRSGRLIDEDETVTLTVDPSVLLPGDYSCMFKVIDPNAVNSPQNVLVDFRVRAILHVPDDFDTIQAAIDAAKDYDIIIIDEGVYSGPGNGSLTIDNKSITIRGSAGPDTCVVDAYGFNFGFHIVNCEDKQVIIEDLAIINSSYYGIYAYKSGITMFNCIVANNAADGVHVYWNKPILQDCIITNNGGDGVESSWYGARISGCSITYNGKDGILCSTMENYPAEVDNCIIQANGQSGISVDGSGNLTLQNSILSYNVRNSSWGWGANCSCSKSFVDNCLILNNGYDSIGVGISIYSGDFVSVNNCIIRGNAMQIGYVDNEAEFTYCNVEEGFEGEGNIDADPLFVAEAYWDENGTPTDPNDDFLIDGDYHLLWDSPCIDAGDPNFVVEEGEVDIDGEPRVMGGRVDMGADEVGPKQADFTRDGRIDIEDFAVFSRCWDTQPTEGNWYILCDLFDDGIIDIKDLAALAADWIWVTEWH